MHLQKKLDTFTPQDWEHTFGAFVKANKSHWRGAPYDAVRTQLKEKRRFEFSVTGMNTWTSKFLLTVDENDNLAVEFISNESLPPIMHKHLAAMKDVFEQEIQKLEKK